MKDKNLKIKEAGDTKQTFLVTGGAGFIGSALCNALIRQGNRVINIDNFNDFYDPKIKKQNVAPLEQHENYHLYKADIRDQDVIDEIFKTHPVDVVIHLAAMAGVRPSITMPAVYEAVNVQGTINLLNAMHQYGVKHMVFASSSSIYGNSKRIPFREDDPLERVISPYAATKKSAEEFCYVFHHLFDLNIVALRFFTVYGPGQRPDLAIHKFTRMILNGEPIPFFGDGTTMRDYAYIDDIVQGVIHAAGFVQQKQPVFEIINLSGNKPVTLSEMVQQIEKATGKKAVLNRLPMQPGDVVLTYADITKAQKLLDFKPETPFEKGIDNFVHWYRTIHNL
ncbi:SDR family NAD(P)-dependent oxidoreductase [Candidatus Sulfidibacterium hydrothermale]|uniref:SDR family NAD(P)-dependent oxidoreductase n=1 Tax=Candidatus Sulfidibacterium hydrothermale TaxID=2875962 RepID=UPI001F0B32AC|nr:SDR family NAD(P)-dependent oxidoreductase [Candidatus Sulfidibacterium hydrothermale]UBM61209.1 SDR family NAD(P)-dependent oxidoreductase [Candidatus Sulfidibacterium hydrothermale]